MVKQKEDGKYSVAINTYYPKEVALVLKEYCEEEGIKAPVIIRKAVIKYLKDHKLLDMNKRYL